jgi:hypothetical protein
MNQEKNIQNKYRIEPLEPRFMLSATAEDATVSD